MMNRKKIIVVLILLFLGGCGHKASYIREDFTLKDKLIAILPFVATQGLEYQEEMASCPPRSF